VSDARWLVDAAALNQLYLALPRTRTWLAESTNTSILEKVAKNNFA
jgi:hypothetical protein